MDRARAGLTLLLFALAWTWTADIASSGGTPACDSKPIAAARRAAQARRDSGDLAGAVRLLQPFVDLNCLPDDARAPKPAERATASAYAWLLNDVYVNEAALHGHSGALEGDEDCGVVLDPLTNADLALLSWMSPALRQATTANVKACVKSCRSLSCVSFRANAFSTYLSLVGSFRDRACPSGAGQALDDGRCIELRGKAGVGFVWSDHIGTNLPNEADERAYCPALYMRAPGGKEAARLELPEASTLRSGSSCCTAFHLRVRPGTDEVMISSDEIAADCNGGTAQTLVEEIYRLSAAGPPMLVQDNSLGLH